MSTVMIAAKTIDHQFGFSSSVNKNNLWLSSSLQDLTSYCDFVLEESDVNLLTNSGAPTFVDEMGTDDLSYLVSFIVWFPNIPDYFVVVCIFIFPYWSHEASKYYFILEYGSTKTHVYVYEAYIDSKKGTSLPILLKSFIEGLLRKLSGCAYGQIEIEPGLHLLQILKHAHKTSSLFLYVTTSIRKFPSASLNLRIGFSTYSLPSCGLDDAFDKNVVHLIKSLPKEDLSLGNIEVEHPYLQSGYREQYTCSQCAAYWCPKLEECISLAKIVPYALHDCLTPPYDQFYTLSGCFVVNKIFNLTLKANVAMNSFPPQPFIEQYCFRAPFIVFLLKEGLDIKDNQIIIGSGSITWTFGVALLEVGKTFSTRLRLHSYEAPLMNIHPIAHFTILFISLILFIFLQRSQIPLFRHNSVSATFVLSIPPPFRFQRWSLISSDMLYSKPRLLYNAELLLSKESQSRKDLNSSLAEAHMAKV
ncbi:hypothetical protein K2173_009582 [Erythroxylum novogranatense]|uniref:Uncharacterized protein n=1 Tax=Erythroxylum novogranatense TaxID=1862640 RepID=A0AAV8U5J1_9ROSI|nr:hypothetical protein K2173_009582 [Erythroxylum novogranatense]